MARRRGEEAKRIGARIAELRERSHLTQPAVAERAKVALRTYQTWEAGDATPRWHNYERLAGVFGVKVEDILGAAGPPEDPAIDQIRRTLAEIKEQLAELTRRLPPEDAPPRGGT